MKVHQQFARAIWDLHLNHHLSPATLSDHNPSNHPGKRLRPLAPNLLPSATEPTTTSVDLKSFIRPDVGPRKTIKDNSPQVETTSSHPGGTRWNPAQEQIGILEMLYRGGMRTPNAQQIEQITAQLSKYGKIEGKNVFYWFQNHKARERQKQKRSLVVAPSPSPSRSTSASFVSSTAVNTSITLNLDASIKCKEELQREGQGSGKRKCRTWPSADSLSPGEITYRKSSANMISESDEEDKEEELDRKRTLELFPLHPEGRLMMGVNCTD